MGHGIVFLAAAASVAQAQWMRAQSGAWTGFLMDDGCRTVNATARCDVSDETAAYGVQTAGGRYYKLEPPAKVREALRKAGKHSGEIRITVTGTDEGDRIRVAAVGVL